MRRITLTHILLTLLVLAVSVGTMADGTITVPVNNAPTQWKISYVVENNGVGGATPGVTIDVLFLNSSGSTVQSQLVASTTPAELNSYLGQMETPVAGEPAGVTLAARAQRRRMRMTKWIVDNAKLTNITPE
jgi:hypothetical protein